MMLTVAVWRQPTRDDMDDIRFGGRNMTRVISLLLVFSFLLVVSAGEGQSRGKFKPPKNPEEYRAMLERVIAN